MAGLLAIASFLGLQTERGRSLVIGIDERLAVGRLLRDSRNAFGITAATALLAMMILYVGSPQAAVLYRRRGVSALEVGHYSQAIRALRQAASLDPDNARTHFNLASAYETIYDYDHAEAAYQLALELDDQFWPAYNNLGRLYLEGAQDARAALAVLLAGQHQTTDPLGQAVIAKNIGWAYLEMGWPHASLSSLDEARSGLLILLAAGDGVDIYLAEVYRLEAKAQAAIGDANEARRAWQDSLGFSLSVAESLTCASAGSSLPADCTDATWWAVEAREWLTEGE
jgi:tetratricopeptide (TPR) repeat protein